MDRDEALSILDDVDNLDGSISDKDATFVDSMLRQLEEEPDRCPTPRQAAWLRDFRDRYL